LKNNQILYQLSLISSVSWEGGLWGHVPPVLTRRGGKIRDENLPFLLLLINFWKQNWGRGSKGQQNEANLSEKMEAAKMARGWQRAATSVPRGM
jgi:hypothetical protein